MINGILSRPSLTLAVYLFVAKHKELELRSTFLCLLAERKTVFAERTTLLGKRSKRESFSKYQNFSRPFYGSRSKHSKIILKVPKTWVIHQILERKIPPRLYQSQGGNMGIMFNFDRIVLWGANEVHSIWGGVQIISFHQNQGNSNSK